MLIIVGFNYENDIFCEIGEFGKGFITCKGLAKNLNETKKENGQWTRIHEWFGKTSIDVTKKGILTNNDYKKMANLGEKRKFRQKWRVQGFG